MSVHTTNQRQSVPVYLTRENTLVAGKALFVYLRLAIKQRGQKLLQ